MSCRTSQASAYAVGNSISQKKKKNRKTGDIIKKREIKKKKKVTTKRFTWKLLIPWLLDSHRERVIWGNYYFFF